MLSGVGNARSEFPAEPKHPTFADQTVTRTGPAGMHPELEPPPGTEMVSAGVGSFDSAAAAFRMTELKVILRLPQPSFFFQRVMSDSKAVQSRRFLVTPEPHRRSSLLCS